MRTTRRTTGKGKVGIWASSWLAEGGGSSRVKEARKVRETIRTNCPRCRLLESPYVGFIDLIDLDPSSCLVFSPPLLPPAPRCICGSRSRERTPLPSLCGRWSQTLVGGEEAAPPLRRSHEVQGQTAYFSLVTRALKWFIVKAGGRRRSNIEDTLFSLQINTSVRKKTQSIQSEQGCEHDLKLFLIVIADELSEEAFKLVKMC